MCLGFHKFLPFLIQWWWHEVVEDGGEVVVNEDVDENG